MIHTNMCNIYRFLMGQPPCLADLRAIDPELHSQLENLLQVKQQNPDSIAEMQLSFTVGCPTGFGPETLNLKDLPSTTGEHILENCQNKGIRKGERSNTAATATATKKSSAIAATSANAREDSTQNDDAALMARALHLSKVDAGLSTDTEEEEEVEEVEEDGDQIMGGGNDDDDDDDDANEEELDEEEEVLVTAENVEEFVELYVAALLRWNVLDQLDAMREGLMEFIPPSAWSGGSPMDFNLLLGGTPTVSVEEIKTRTQVSGGAGGASTQLLSMWFWQVVESMTQLQRSKLLYFATGSTRLPTGSATALHVEIVSSMPSDALPTSATCTKKLIMPAYVSMEQLRSKLLLAIENCNNYELQ